MGFSPELTQSVAANKMSFYGRGKYIIGQQRLKADQLFFRHGVTVLRRGKLMVLHLSPVTIERRRDGGA